MQSEREALGELASSGDWEMVSSSDDGLAGDDAALATTFLQGEPNTPAGLAAAPGRTAGRQYSSGEEEVEGAVGAAAAPLVGAPGSPERGHRLQLMAAPALEGAASPDQLNPLLLPDSQVFDAGALAAAKLAAAEAAEAAAALENSRCSLTFLQRLPEHGGVLRAARPGEQEAVMKAVVEMESRRPSEHERSVQESRDAHRIRRVMMIACSVCAFLGLKALLGAPMAHSSMAAVGASAVHQPSADAAALDDSRSEPAAPAGAQETCGVEEAAVRAMGGTVGIYVEPLAPCLASVSG